MDGHPTRLQAVAVTHSPDMRRARQRVKAQLRAGPVVPVPRATEANQRCGKCGKAVDATIDGRCRACAEDTSAWLSPAARADARRMDRLDLTTKVERLNENVRGLINAVERLERWSDESRTPAGGPDPLGGLGKREGPDRR